MRVGIGYDSHRLVGGRKLILGGECLAHEKGLQGHSDADVLIHAVCDAILGAIGAGDLGGHFPDTDPLYKGVSGIELLQQVGAMAKEKDMFVNNIDVTIMLEAPNLTGHKSKMAANIAAALDLAACMVNIKAKTNEGMGFVGRREGIAAIAVVTIGERQE